MKPQRAGISLTIHTIIYEYFIYKGLERYLIIKIRKLYLCVSFCLVKRWLGMLEVEENIYLHSFLSIPPQKHILLHEDTRPYDYVAKDRSSMKRIALFLSIMSLSLASLFAIVPGLTAHATRTMHTRSTTAGCSDASSSALGYVTGKI